MKKKYIKGKGKRLGELLIDPRHRLDSQYRLEIFLEEQMVTYIWFPALSVSNFPGPCEAASEKNATTVQNLHKHLSDRTSKIYVCNIFFSLTFQGEDTL